MKRLILTIEEDVPSIGPQLMTLRIQHVIDWDEFALRTNPRDSLLSDLLEIDQELQHEKSKALLK